MAQRKYVLVTGSSDGIGKAVAMGFVQKGMPVIFHGSNTEKLEAIRQHLPATADCRIWQADLSDLKTTRLALQQLDGCSVGALVLCAGRIPVTKFKAIDQSRFVSALNVNALAHLVICQQLVDKGSVDFVCSLSTLSTLFGVKGYALYAATKALLNAFPQYFADTSVPFINLILGDIIKNEDGLILGNQALTGQLANAYPFGLGSSQDVFEAVFTFFQNRSSLKSGTYRLDGGITNKLAI